MQMPGRFFTANNSGYRYGFNGQEKSSELNGDGNLYTAQFWEYDARIVRRWNLDPRSSVGISPYSAFGGNPILNSDPFGDTTVTGAGGAQSIDIDEKANSLEFYSSENYKINGTNTSVPVQGGQLRSFSNTLGTFRARWSTDKNGAAVFAGYKNENNQTVDDVVKEVNSWKYKAVAWLTNFGNSKLKEYSANPVAYNLQLTTTMLAMAAGNAVEPAPYMPGYNPSVTTKGSMSALGTLRFAEANNLALGLGIHLDDFSQATGFMNYRQFTSGAFKPDEISAAIQSPNNNLHFNLQDFTRWKYLKYANNPVAPSPMLRNVTNWELHTIYNTPGALQRTTFYNFLNSSYQIVKPPF